MPPNSLRLALWVPALGRGRQSRPTEKMIRRENCLGCAQNLQRHVHALLGAFQHRNFAFRGCTDFTFVIRIYSFIAISNTLN